MTDDDAALFDAWLAALEGRMLGHWDLDLERHANITEKFRDQRAAAEKAHDHIAASLEELRTQLRLVMPRSESEARHTIHDAAIQALSVRLTAIEAARTGGRETLSGIYALVAFLVGLLVLGSALAAGGVLK